MDSIITTHIFRNPFIVDKNNLHRQIKLLLQVREKKKFHGRYTTFKE